MEAHARLKTVAKQPWFWFVLAGYTLRIMLMPLTAQHDVMFMPWMTHFINQGNTNLYAYLHQRFGDVVMRSPGVWAPYPYGYYLYTAGWIEMLEQLRLLSLENWAAIWEVAHPARLVFLFKAAYLPFDLLIAYLLYLTCGRLGIALWAWSPTAIYTPFMMGQNDIYATAFAVLAAYAAARSIRLPGRQGTSATPFPDRWAVLASVALGIGAAFKIYPLLFLPLLALIMGRSWAQRLQLLAPGLLIFGATVLPFVSTPTFVNGVLFNPEGVGILKGVPVLGVSIPPFVVSYVVLGLAVLVFGLKSSSDGLPWAIGMAVLALLFLWTTTPFYWLIWITPFVIGAIAWTRRLWLVWLALQLSFVVTLFAQHRELNVALPIHLSSRFNVPNLPTILGLEHPAFARVYEMLVGPAARALLVCSLLLILSFAAMICIRRPARFNTASGSPLAWLIVAPTAVMLLGLAANLYLSRNYVSSNNWYTWQARELAAGEWAVQSIDSDARAISGIRLRIAEASTAAAIKLCLYQAGTVTQPPTVCVTRTPEQHGENNILYFVFDRPVSPGAGTVVKVEVAGENARVTLPYATTKARNVLELGDQTLNGKLDVSPLTSFDITEAADSLVADNVLKDAPLLLSVLLLEVIVAVFVGGVVVLGRRRLTASYMHTHPAADDSVGR